MAKQRIYRAEGGAGSLTDKETVLNVGHKSNQMNLTENPTSHQPPYEGKDSELAKTLRRDNNARGMYGQIGKLDSGIASADNLAKWGKFSEKNSYQGDPAYKRGYTKR